MQSFSQATAETEERPLLNIINQNGKSNFFKQESSIFKAKSNF